jgi:hypothetical protein
MFDLIQLQKINPVVEALNKNLEQLKLYYEDSNKD